MPEYDVSRLPGLSRAYRYAIPVWVWLLRICVIKNKRTAYVSRIRIARNIGTTRLENVSTALGILSRGGWIRIRHKAYLNKDGKYAGTYLQITVIKTLGIVNLNMRKKHNVSQ